MASESRRSSVTFTPTPAAEVPSLDFAGLPGPDPDLPRAAQRELFIAAHGGTDAAADFERWWDAHTDR